MTQRLHLLFLLAPLICAGSPAAWADEANPIVVVPGANAGYLFFPESSGTEEEAATESNRLVIVKEGFTDYTISSEPAGVTCDASCTTFEDDIAVGSMRLTISGHYSVGTAEIPVSGSFSGQCVSDDGATECAFAHATGIASEITITVPSSPIGAQFAMSDGGPVVTYMGQLAGNHIIAATAHKQTGLVMSTAAVDVNADSNTDGAANTARFVGGDSTSAAAVYCNTLASASGIAAYGDGWYLPARDEGMLLQGFTAEAYATAFGAGDLKLWTSTEVSGSGSFVYRIKGKAALGYEKLETDKEKAKTDSHIVCMKPL